MATPSDSLLIVMGDLNMPFLYLKFSPPPNKKTFKEAQKRKFPLLALRTPSDFNTVNQIRCVN